MLGKFVRDLFSSRKEAPSLSDVYSYDDIPPKLRTQVALIIQETLAYKDATEHRSYRPYDAFHEIWRLLRHQRGVSELPISDKYVDGSERPEYVILNYLIQEPNIDYVMDALEVCIGEIERHGEEGNLAAYHRQGLSEANARNAVDSINVRFDRAGVGYFYKSGQMHRKDTEAVHHLAVMPALTVLSDSRFAAANSDFLKAHEHFREGRFDDAMVNCGKTIESVLKIICDDRGWPYKVQKDTLAPLVEVARSQGMVRPYMVEPFKLVGMLRNKEKAAHGPGNLIYPNAPSDKTLSSLCLGLTASIIVYLATVDGEMP